MRKRILFGLVLVAVIFALLIVAGVIKPHTVEVPDASQQQTLSSETPDGVSRGEYVARMSDCTACHTTDKNKPYAGGLAMPLPIGTIYSTNITPDKDTGIGHYTLTDFSNVLREGVTKEGSHLYPAMPYTAYTKLSDSDIKAMYDYFMNEVRPIHEANRASDIPTLLSMRWPLAFWNWMFLDKGAYQIDTKQSEAWNRGAYLVQGATHCSTCHTPRGLAMEEKATDEKTTGFLSGADLAGWHAFNITNDKTSGLGNWTDEQIVQYLKTGSVQGKAQAAGPMAEAIEHSFRHMTDSDLQAIATYLRSVQPVNDSDANSRFTQGSDTFVDMSVRGKSLAEAKKEMPGASLYMGNCASCHDANGSGSSDGYYPSLYHNSVVGTDHTSNLINVILNGVHRTNNDGEIMMPAFRRHLSDDQIATLVNFVTKTYGRGDTKVTPEKVKQQR